MKSLLKWILVITCVLALIIIPFILFGKSIEDLVKDLLTKGNSHSLLTAGFLALLLASDILLPIPSSIVSTACGYFAGIIWGMLFSFAGMTVSCIAGYWIGKILGRPASGRLLDAAQMNRLEDLWIKAGDWTVLICRPVPVLAEASVFFAGISNMPFHRFFLLNALSNLGISAVYAVIGSLSSSANSFLLAFAAAIILPGLFMLLFRRRKSREV